MGGIANSKITAIGSGSAEAEAVEVALKPTASKTLVTTTATTATTTTATSAAVVAATASTTATTSDRRRSTELRARPRRAGRDADKRSVGGGSG